MTELLTPAQVALHLRDAGFTGDPLVTMTAICLAESGVTLEGVRYADADAEGDIGLQTAKWGASIGFPQIRSLKPGRPELAAEPWRDPAYLRAGPANQAAAAWKTYTTAGNKFTLWSTFTVGTGDQDYKTWLEAAREGASAVGGTNVAPTAPGSGTPTPTRPGPATAPPSASLTPGTRVVVPTTLQIDGEQVLAKFQPVSSEIVRTVEGADRITLVVPDPKREFIRSKVGQQKSRMTLDGIVFELTGIDKRGSDVTLTWTDAAAAEYLADAGTASEAQLSMPAGAGTRGTFLKVLAKRVPWVQVDIEAGDYPNVPLTRGTPDNPFETTWAALRRLAADVGWRCCATGNRLLIGSDEWLMSRAAPIEVRERRGGVDDVDFVHDRGVPADEAYITCDTRFWGIAPTQAVVLADLGFADGGWMVADFRRELAATQATIRLVRPQAELPEPVADTTDVPGDEGGKEFNESGEVTTGPVSPEGFIWPNEGRVISTFGACRPQNGNPCGRSHKGIDVAADTGTPVVAPKAGTVIVAHPVDNSAYGGYGKVVYVDHNDGWVTRSAHLDTVAVTRGQYVEQGQKVGTVGNTGNARTTPPHTHFETRRNGDAIDPLTVLVKP